MKTQEQIIEWFISAVKSTLILNFGITEEEAGIAVNGFGLREKIMKKPIEELQNSVEGTAEQVARFEFVGRPSQLTYKGFFTKVMYDTNMKSLYGRVYGTDEFISFEAESPADVETRFHKVVDDYLEVVASRDKDIDIEFQRLLAEDKEDVENIEIISVDNIIAAPKTLSETGENRSYETISDEDFLRFMGINPEEEVSAEDPLWDVSEKANITKESSETVFEAQEPQLSLTESDDIKTETQEIEETESDEVIKAVPEKEIIKNTYEKQKEDVFDEFEVVDLNSAVNKANNNPDSKFLRLFGINPDDVIL